MKTRFAPSPTGSLHIGGARTALYNFLLAKHFGGSFILRIEDTDTARNTEASLNQLLEELTWLGLSWDEGPDLNDPKHSNGPHGPYCQSQRHSTYLHYAEKLLASGHAYYCFATEDEIQAQKDASNETHSFKFSSPYRELSLHEAKEKILHGDEAVIRYKNTHQNETFSFTDLVRGHIELPGDMIGDFVLLRRDQRPVYNFCCAIDDALMEITHVLRGEEHLPNTLRQMMIYQALGLETPQYGHLSLILDQDHKKLSKRSGASSISDFQKLGYTADGLLNYLALLGWSDPQHREILSRDDLIASFTTDRLHAAAPMYDMEKLRWVNSQHLKKLSISKLEKAILPFIEDMDLPNDSTWRQHCLSFFRQDFHTLAEAQDILRGYTIEPQPIDTEGKDILSWPDTSTVLHRWIQALVHACSEHSHGENVSASLTRFIDKHTLAPGAEPSRMLQEAISNINNTNVDKGTFQAALLQDGVKAIPLPHDFCISPNEYTLIADNLKKYLEIQGKKLFMPLRVAMIGTPHGADMKIIIQILTAQQLIIRALYCIAELPR